MPRFDYECADGHVEEQTQDREVDSALCGCGLPSQRVTLTAPLANGFAERPTREAPVNLTRAVEAHGETLRAHEKAGTTPPDFFGEAKRRVAAGDVAAID